MQGQVKERVEDRWVRLIFVPILGMGIPVASGLFGPFGPGSGEYWFGCAWFILISFTIWTGNRYFHSRLRGQPDWLSQPARRAVLLLTSSLALTAPYAVGMLLAWYRLVGLPPDWHAIRNATLLIVVCTMFIMHTYETVYLIRQRTRDQLAVEQLARAKAQAELDVLRAQIDPHFMFNCLNTLAGLIEEDPERATDFTVCLAEVYRYILRSRNHELVPLRQELAFLRNYYALLRLRFDNAMELIVRVDGPELERGIPPVSLQLLLENAVKHNDFSSRAPLRVHVEMDGGAVAVWNEKRRLPEPRATSRLGLKNLDERCRLTIGKPLETRDEGGRFLVRVPLGDGAVEAIAAGAVGIPIER